VGRLLLWYGVSEIRIHFLYLILVANTIELRLAIIFLHLLIVHVVCAKVLFLDRYLSTLYILLSYY